MEACCCCCTEAHAVLAGAGSSLSKRLFEVEGELSQHNLVRQRQLQDAQEGWAAQAAEEAAAWGAAAGREGGSWPAAGEQLPPATPDAVGYQLCHFINKRPADRLILCVQVGSVSCGMECDACPWCWQYNLLGR